MKVLYDHQAFTMQNFGGISKYFSCLIDRVPGAMVAIKYTDNIHIRSVSKCLLELLPSKLEYKYFLMGLRFPGWRRVYRKWSHIRGVIGGYNHRLALNTIQSGQFEVFHPTYYNTYFLKHIGSKPFVITIYDMIHEKFPEFFPLGDETSRNKKILANLASRIIAISENTKKDIVDIFNVPSEKIDVVYLGITENKKKPEVSLRRQKYILFTGTRSAYKNFYFMVTALAPLLSASEELILVCTGPAFSNEEQKFFKTLMVEDKIIHKFASDDDLIELYAGAACFIFPSYYEGFGIPILEAFSAGCPAALADTGCFREIGQGAALYFNPKEELEIRKSVLNILGDEQLAASLVAKGRERVSEFSWDLMADKTLDVYRKVLL